MKNVLVTILSFLLCLCLVACDTVHLGDEVGETPAANKPESNIGGENMSAKLPVVYTSSSDTLADRILLTADFLFLSYTRTVNDLDRGCAMCLITVMDIDLDDVSSGDIGSPAPLTLRVDKVFLSNDAFTLKEGDCFSSVDYANWFRTDDVYSVEIIEGFVPVAEPGAQYFGLLRAGCDDCVLYDDIDLDVDYTIKCSTLPIPAANVSADEVAAQFAEMKLSDDVRNTSVGVIKRLFGDAYIPDYDDIEAAFLKIVG